MKLLGRRNWYLPGWLGWLPRIGAEPVARSVPSPVLTANVSPVAVPTGPATASRPTATSSQR
jgi:hypothetical protein